MKDLDHLHYFLDTSVEQQFDGLFLHQRQYAQDILERAGMNDCNPCSMSINTEAKVSFDMSSPVRDSTGYRSLTKALQYLTFTKPDISYAVQQLCLHMHNPREPHLTTTKHILC
jgi:hypothetical protein